jgi:monovalent cation/proton antiporter MnhG/PhaG subunit
VRDVVVAALLILGAGLGVVCAVGVLAMRDPFDRLHYTSPASLAAAAVAAAIVVRESFSLIGNKAILLAFLFLVTSPVLVHVTARAARLREHGRWGPRPEEGLEVEEP